MANPRDLTLRQLRYFKSAAETGQFSQAAMNNHVSQSAITTAIGQLEASLGVNLFERLSHGVRLTLEGHRFLEKAQTILYAVQDAMVEPLATTRSLSGVVRIGASYTVLGYYLPTLLARFRRSYPEIVFDLHDLDRVSIERGVKSGTLDLGIIISSNSEQSLPLDKVVLMRSRRQVWLATDHELMAKESISLQDIRSFPYLLLTVDEGERSAMRYWKEGGMMPEIALRTGSMEALRGFVANGFGVTILSDMVYRAWSLEGRRLETRPISDSIPDMELGLIWDDAALKSAPAKALHQFLLYAGHAAAG
ncbi:LysR substrate-binding domain-containing protein [Pseudomonas sp. Z18(2022)]|uniref:LysR substrate-binding domain-containing protein n=1 Tax=Pseudomonas sp. Z18(2022) TaxID=2983410 RepID=UPI002E814B3F|nr:LysR substrate-binding domain-containing protein [Pseudomonas sp. Z18(2022)]